MDEKFQDRIDNYLLNRMDDTEKTEFLHEVEQDKEKRELLEFTQHVKDSICSREEKLQALADFQRQYEEENCTDAYLDTAAECNDCKCLPSEVMPTEPLQSQKKIWIWLTSIAAVLVVGFVTFKPMFKHTPSSHINLAPVEQIRGGEKEFSPTPAYKTRNDTIKNNKKKKRKLK